MRFSFLKKIRITAHTTTFRCALVASTLLIVSQSYAFPIRMALAPDTNQSVLNSLIHSAKQELVINIYQFESPEIAEVIVAKIRSGVTVRILAEGEPLGNVSPDGKKLLAAISGAIRASKNPESQLLLMTRPNKETQKRRYRYNHAKYVIADKRFVLISSENFTATGHPNPGDIGNRGWNVVLDNPNLAEELLETFWTDADPSYGDVKELKTTGRELPPSQARGPRKTAPIPDAVGNASHAKLVEAPFALDEITALIRSARKRIDVEKMSLPSTWRSPSRYENPIVTELIRAAQRGVQVRVLLNDESVFSGGPFPDTDDSQPKKGNALTVELLETVGRSERIPLVARTVNVRAADITYIHNKGILVDGEQAFVSSINGTQNSVENNREIAVLLQSRDAARYYGAAFEFDWQASARRPFERVMKAFETSGALQPLLSFR